MKDDLKNIDTNILITNIQKKFKLSSKDIINLSRDFTDIKIPITIFSDKLGLLESVCVYLHDEIDLSFKQIAAITKRDYSTVYTSYTRGKQKLNGT